MSSPTSAGWSSETREGEHDFLRRAATFLLKGLAVGLLAGMSAFVYNMPQFIATDVDSRLLLVPLIAAGAFAHLFTPTLRRSIRLGLVGFFVGLAVFVGAWTAPLWLLDYSATGRDVLLLKMSREAIAAAFINYAAAYLGGYLLTVSITAFWE